MLRIALFVLGGLLLAWGVRGAIIGGIILGPAIPGAIIVLALIAERYVYKPMRTNIPGPEWQRTEERFVDPKSGETVAVWFNPRTGERRYVVEPHR